MCLVGGILFLIVEEAALHAKLSYGRDQKLSVFFKDPYGQLGARDLLLQNGASVEGQGGL